MNFLKNRTVIGVICILLALIICFAVTPLFNKTISEKTEIVRVVKPVKIGEEITADKVSVVEVGGYNLPEDVVRNLDTAIGNAYLYNLTGKKQAISVSLKAFANGLSGKLQSGDIVSVIAPDYKKQGSTVIPPELQYVEVIAVTANSGYDANTNTQNGEEDNTEKELPGTVTLLVTPEQSKILAELEADGKAHISLVFRGPPEQSAAFISAQETVLLELYPPVEEETEDSESGALEEQTDESEASETEQTDIAEDETAETEGEVWESEVE